MKKERETIEDGRFLAKTHPTDQITTMDKKEQDARTKHFEDKAKWKDLPGNRYDPRKAEKPPKLELVRKPLPGGLVLTWI